MRENLALVFAAVVGLGSSIALIIMGHVNDDTTALWLGRGIGVFILAVLLGDFLRRRAESRKAEKWKGTYR